MSNKLPAVIQMVEENCTNCHQCIAVCPIKYCNNGISDTVKINHDLCIGCGQCVAACIASHNGMEAQAARHYIDDTNELLRALKHRPVAALIAPSAQSNFDLPRLITALKKLGFTAVYDVAFGGEITIACYHQLIEEHLIKPPIIAQPCPAIVKYIELNHPALLPHLVPVGSPIHNLAVYVHSLHPEYQLAFISPCLAKRREFTDSQLVNYNVIYKSINKILEQQNIDLKDLEPGDFDNIIPSGMAAIFSSPGGLKGTYLHHYPATNPYLITRVSGRMVYEKYLADLEAAVNQKSENLPLIVDILNCENGCNMGPGCINHQRSVDEVEIAIARRAERNLQQAAKDSLDTFLDSINPADYHYDHYQDLSDNHQIKMPADEELAAIYEAMLKSELRDYRNCGACGYNSCSRMAIAIYNGLNKAQNCHLYQEKALRNDQERFQTIAREIGHAFTEVQSSAAELSHSTGLTLNNFTEVISNIGSFRDMSVEMADKAEKLTPFVQTISLIAKALQEQLNFLQQMIDTIPTPIFFRDTDGVFQGCNKAFELVVGQPRGNIVGRHLDRILPLDLAEKYREMDMEMMNNPGILWSEDEFDADGVHHNVIINQAPFYNMDGELLGVVGVNVDITEHKQMEQEVMRLDRLRMVGEMAAGIAHEIRNPMTTVRGFLQMMMGQPDTAGYSDYLEMMIQELDSANGIISEFLSLARDKMVNLKLQNLNNIIETLGPLLNAQALNQDKWINLMAGEIPDLYLDAQQIRQLVINLARNGLEAMEPGGVLTISTYSTDQEVFLIVADQGHGINPEILPKLGTPFFTTKEQGTGLGLAVCYSIVTRHNASIEVETNHNGTAFIIKFQYSHEVSSAV